MSLGSGTGVGQGTDLKDPQEVREYVDNLGIVTSSGRVLGPIGGQGGGQRNCLESLPVGCDIRRTFLDRIKVI